MSPDALSETTFGQQTQTESLSSSVDLGLGGNSGIDFDNVLIKVLLSPLSFFQKKKKKMIAK